MESSMFKAQRRSVPPTKLLLKDGSTGTISKLPSPSERRNSYQQLQNSEQMNTVRRVISSEAGFQLGSESSRERAPLRYYEKKRPTIKFQDDAALSTLLGSSGRSPKREACRSIINSVEALQASSPDIRARINQESLQNGCEQKSIATSPSACRSCKSARPACWGSCFGTTTRPSTTTARP